MTRINYSPDDLLPREWAFDPIKGPFFRALLDMNRQIKSVIGDDDTVEALLTRIAQNETDIDTNEADIAFNRRYTLMLS